MVKGGICKDCFRVGPIDTICNYCSRKENGFKQNSYLSYRTTDGEINPLQLSLAAETAIDMPKYWELKTWYFDPAEDQCRNMNLEGKWTKSMESRAKKMIKYVGDQAKLDEDNKRQKTDESVDEEEEGTGNVAKKPAAK